MNALARIQRLRECRTRRTEPASLADELRSIADRLRAADATRTRGQQAWHAHAPGPLRSLARSIELSRGCLVVRATDASARFEIDRWLRSGGGQALARQCGARRVRTTL